MPSDKRRRLLQFWLRVTWIFWLRRRHLCAADVAISLPLDVVFHDTASEQPLFTSLAKSSLRLPLPLEVVGLTWMPVWLNPVTVPLGTGTVEVFRVISIHTLFVSMHSLVFPLQTCRCQVSSKTMSTSTLYRCRDETDDLDLRKYSRRISLRAPPLPNVTNAQPFCETHFSHLILSLSSVRS